MSSIKHWLVAAALACLVACGGVVGNTPPVPPTPVPPIIVVPPSPPSPPAVGPAISVVGKEFYKDGQLYIPRWTSELSILRRTREEMEALLDEDKSYGFDGVRVFAGALGWVSQTADAARDRLPILLEVAAQRGMVVEVTALTDSKDGGYDPYTHLLKLAIALRGQPGVVVELANEPWHPTQSDAVHDVEQLKAWGEELFTPRDIIWSIGASEEDEPVNDVYVTSGGLYSTAHLDRGRDFWNQLRRVREIFAITEVSGKPAINNEPIGCAEPGTLGQRLYDPTAFAVLGALDRAFSIGGVHHSQAGLMAEVDGPVQKECAKTYLAASFAVEEVMKGRRGIYKNVNHEGSPVVAADFDSIVRVYSFLMGDEAVTVSVGEIPGASITWGNGWRPKRIVREFRRDEDGRRLVIREVERGIVALPPVEPPPVVVPPPTPPPPAAPVDAYKSLAHLEIPQGWYCDTLPSREYACLVPGGVQTHFGVVAVNPTWGAGPLFIRVAGNPFRFAGQGHQIDALLTYDGEWHVDPSRVPCGVSPVIYDAAGHLHVSDCSIGSQGWRYVEQGTGRLVTGDETYGPAGKPFVLYEYTVLGDNLVVGQGAESGAAIWDGTTLRSLAAGNCRFIRASRLGDVVAIAIWRIGQPSLLVWATVDQLKSLPEVK